MTSVAPESIPVRRVALVHDWLTGMRGGERVLEAIVGLFPAADIFCLLHVPGSVSELLESRRIHTSFVQHLPASRRAYRWYLPLFPWAIEQLDLGGHDLVISTSHCVAKAALTEPGTVHVCYCFTPMRYAYDQFDSYFSRERLGRLGYGAIAATMSWLRRWDRATASRVDAFAADSRWVASRIGRHYDRLATVIPPPVDTDFFVPGTVPEPDNYWLVVSALAPYKRVEVAISAFNRLGRPLVVVGSGPEEARLRATAGPTIDMRGHVDDHELRHLYQRCRGLVLPSVEDAGIVPLEAMACGRPALVLVEGGAAETVIDGETGIHIDEAGPDALIDAVDRAEGLTFNTDRIRAHAVGYGSDVFVRRFTAFVADAIRTGTGDRHPAAPTPNSPSPVPVVEGRS